MAAARTLLLTTDLSAEQVARRVGYDDPRYFNRRFRAFHGVAPGRWRASAAGPSSGGVAGNDVTRDAVVPVWTSTTPDPWSDACSAASP